jgi:hypothetical protein
MQALVTLPSTILEVTAPYQTGFIFSTVRKVYSFPNCLGFGAQGLADVNQTETRER